MRSAGGRRLRTWPSSTGRTALIVSDGADHRRRRSVIAPGLRHREIQNYVHTMASTIDTVIDGWRPGQRLDIYQEFRSAVRRSTAESLFGPRVAAHSDFLGAQLQPLLDLTHRLPQVMQMQRWAKTPAWRRAMTARARINDLIDAQIAEARSAPRPDDHMLTMLINGRGDEGYALTTMRFAIDHFDDHRRLRDHQRRDGLGHLHAADRAGRLGRCGRRGPPRVGERPPAPTISPR